MNRLCCKLAQVVNGGETFNTGCQEIKGQKLCDGDVRFEGIILAPFGPVGVLVTSIIGDRLRRSGRCRRWSHSQPVYGVTTCLENVEMSGNLTAVREMSEMSGEKILSGKSCLKLFIVSCIFVSIQVLVLA